MGFRINTNIAAMNAHRNSTMTNGGLNKSLNALSSGFRINKSADDASGMSIANKLRQQAQGLGQAIANANDGIGVAQIADGAIEEYTKIIDTIRTKAVQAASDGQNISTRTKIQADIDRLMEEAQNIASTTSFNGKTLLNGAFQNKSFHIGSFSGETVKMSIADSQTHKVAKFAFEELAIGFTNTETGATAVKSSVSLKIKNSDGTIKAASGSIDLATGVTHTAREITQAMVDAFNTNAQTNMVDVRASIVEATGSSASKPQYTIRFDSSGEIMSGTTTDNVDDGIATSTASTTKATLDNALSTLKVTTRRDAEKAIIIADYALQDIDKTRSDIGSVQNQLESTVRNISVTQVNITAAESQIRDVDFAKESAQFSKQNILAQSGTYAMSQANAVQQNVMRLLQ
jgi:flagellin